MKGVRVDPAANTVRAEAGCTQADLNHAAHSFGLAVPVGVVSTTGIAGLTLGGTGYLTRKYGLALDNLLEADLILADGRFVTVNAKENPDLSFGRSAVVAITLALLRRSCFVGVRLTRSLPDRERVNHDNRKRRPRSIRKILLGVEPNAQWGCRSVGRHLVPQRDRDDNVPNRRSRSRVGPG